jgi:hypothetical protein
MPKEITEIKTEHIGTLVRVIRSQKDRDEKNARLHPEGYRVYSIKGSSEYPICKLQDLRTGKIGLVPTDAISFLVLSIDEMHSYFSECATDALIAARRVEQHLETLRAEALECTHACARVFFPVKPPA